MIEWASENWGNIASVFGLALSVLALILSQQATTAVRAFRTRQKLVLVLIELEGTLTIARNLTRTTGKQFPRSTCDTPREKLVSLLGVPELSQQEREAIRVELAWFHRPIANNSDSQESLRRMIDDLVGFHRRFYAQIEESII